MNSVLINPMMILYLLYFKLFESNKPPFYRYKQIWYQLEIADGVLYHQYSPSPVHQVVSILILPTNLHKDALRHNHDVPVAGYFGKEKTLECLCCDGYWINIPKDVDDYCGRCSICQQSKLSMCAPLQSIPIEQPWQIIAEDILKVPLSTNNNYYLLMIQSLSRNTAELIQFCHHKSYTLIKAAILKVPY